MKIGEVAAHTGVSVDALRFYEEKGLIKPLRAANGYRFYPEQTLQLIGYIKLAQQFATCSGTTRNETWAVPFPIFLATSLG